MTAVAVPAPTRRRARPSVDAAALEADLRTVVVGEVRFDEGSRAAYSTDASNYRYTPIGVVVPETVETVVDVVAACRRHGAPLLSRGGGTSLGGQCTNVAVVVDWSKHCNRVLSVDAERRTCVVEPGIVLDELNEQLAPYGLEFGPKPATHDHCTIGGMIGNNSCGSTAQRTGKVVDNVARLEVLLYDGTRAWVGPTDDDEYARIASEGGRLGELYRALRALRDEHGDLIRARYPQIPRRVSGYNLDSLLPELGFDIAGFLVGSESTLVTVLRAELELVPVVAAKAVMLLGYGDIAEAGDAVPDVVACSPTALEGLDDKLLRFEREKHLHAEAVDLVPEGGAWLLVEVGGTDKADADANADRLLETIGRHRDDRNVTFYDDPRHERELWEVREAGLAATARTPHGPDTWPGWEDSAVDPKDLGRYLRAFIELLDRYGYSAASLYGHFGQGCLHTSIPFDLRSAAGVAAFRGFVEEAADLVASLGGSFSGEHGDGQARGELLGRMFGDDVVDLFRQVKSLFDPDNNMNPGRVVDADPLDTGLRLGADYRHVAGPTYFSYPEDKGDFGRAVLRCVGVGKCRRDGGGVMCPSYVATREEEHSTRGRARLLFEMLDGGARGGAVTDGWRSEAVRDALDLCLACKGCRSDCPVGVDMATYKVEFLAHHYAGRVRPASHYSMGWLPVAALAAARAPKLVNRVFSNRTAARAVKRIGGIDQHRALPAFAPETLRRRFGARSGAHRGTLGTVLLWPDTFTNHFDPDIGMAAVDVIEAAGWGVTMPDRALCCGLTWISTGQLATARRVLRRTVAALRDHLRCGGLVVGLEPSCTAVFRTDAADLLPGDDDVARLRHQTVTLAELLCDHTPGWKPPPIDRRVLVQTHCHQHAVLRDAADRAVLAESGADVEILDSGCCGLAGNFGFERGHYDVSMACAERVLLPAVRAASADDVVLADGFSCRTQISQGTDGARHAIHLAQLLSGAQ
ncbi:MAG TPA: FAD-binding and (Fe-S)-binding domain-containing protein [Jatrophihabitantaceae bacterium]|nr:FAD-binding and (Fe-S)-binding domain-containing protein [Jatrophihabitantaceae bacterium]